MSYLVFARKWRPQSFEDVLAQEHVTVTLRNAIDAGRAGHAYLFAGPRGVGKTTTARILAKALNCEKGPTSSPCQVCDSCRRIAAGTDLDVLEIDGASNRGIDEVRELREKARYSSASGRWKIYIIDEIHMLTREAFNALLKILEEPPDLVAFVFATTEPRKVPPTIISRCQRFDFRRIPTPVMSAYLAREAASEGIEIDQEAILLVCRASGGSMRDALSIMDQLVSFSGGRITRESAEGLLRVVEEELLASLCSDIFSGRAAGALDKVGDALARGYSVEELCDALAQYLRNLMLVAAGSTAGLEDLPDRELSELRSIAASVDDLAVLNVLRIVSAAASEVRTSSLPRVVVESAVLSASELSSAVGLVDLPPVERKSRARELPAGRSGSEPGPAPAEGAGPHAPGQPQKPQAGRAQRSTAQAGPAAPGPEASKQDGAEERPGNAGGAREQDEQAEAEKKVTMDLLDLFDAPSYENSSDRRPE
jgi:DNA polymerase-3 subunit gamma/tau